MERKEFKITINASKEEVWNILWNCESYPKWTAPFCEGSYTDAETETDWKEGSKIKFLGPDGSGMLSRIKKKRTSRYHIL